MVIIQLNKFDLQKQELKTDHQPALDGLVFRIHEHRQFLDGNLLQYGKGPGQIPVMIRMEQTDQPFEQLSHVKIQDGKRQVLLGICIGGNDFHRPDLRPEFKIFKSILSPCNQDCTGSGKQKIIQQYKLCGYFVSIFSAVRQLVFTRICRIFVLHVKRASDAAAGPRKFNRT